MTDGHCSIDEHSPGDTADSASYHIISSHSSYILVLDAPKNVVPEQYVLLSATCVWSVCVCVCVQFLFETAQPEVMQECRARPHVRSDIARCNFSVSCVCRVLHLRPATACREEFCRLCQLALS